MEIKVLRVARFRFDSEVINGTPLVAVTMTHSAKMPALQCQTHSHKTFSQCQLHTNIRSILFHMFIVSSKPDLSSEEMEKNLLKNRWKKCMKVDTHKDTHTHTFILSEHCWCWENSEKRLTSEEENDLKCSLWAFPLLSDSFMQPEKFPTLPPSQIKVKDDLPTAFGKNGKGSCIPKPCSETLSVLYGVYVHSCMLLEHSEPAVMFNFITAHGSARRVRLLRVVHLAAGFDKKSPRFHTYTYEFECSIFI